MLRFKGVQVLCGKLYKKIKREVTVNTTWLVGDGTNIEVHGQPWYGQWNEGNARVTNRINMKVSDLYDFGTKQRKEQLIIDVLGQQAVQQIKQSVRHLVTQPVLEDRLIWIKEEKREFYSQRGVHSNCLYKPTTT